MLRLPDRLKLLNRGQRKAAEDYKDGLVPYHETKDTSQLDTDTDTVNNDNAGTATQDCQDINVNRGSSSSSRSSSVITSTGRDPLKYPEILLHLFQLCPAPILATCRLVCKLWYEESLLTWRSSVPLSVNMKDGQPEIFVGGCQSTPLKEFLDFTTQPVNQCDRKPFRNILIQRGEFPKIPKTIFNMLWDPIGSALANLTLSMCTFKNIDEIRQVIYECCPVLQKLSIDRCNIIDYLSSDEENIENNGLQVKQRYGENRHLKSLLCVTADNKDLPLSWFELFCRYPSLTWLEYRASDEWDFIDLIRAIRAIRRTDTSKLPLKYFQLHPYLTISRDLDFYQRFEVVKELHLPLKGCSIEVHPAMDIFYVTTTLQDLAPSVNTVILDMEGEVRKAGKVLVPALSQDFPYGLQLDNLTKLESRGDLIGTFEFLKYTPNLRSLDISDGVLDSGVKSISSTKAISNTCEESLTNLQMAHLATLKIGFRVSVGDIILLFQWMPNITNLKMVLNDHQFVMVCRKWRNLRELTVFGDLQDKLLTEETVTGIGKRKKIRPDIANLECLESLVLEVLGLTPESVHHLFLQLPNLRTIHNHGRDTVKRGDLDISSYQRAILRCSYYATNVACTPLPKLFYDVVKQWISENSNGVKEITPDCD